MNKVMAFIKWQPSDRAKNRMEWGYLITVEVVSLLGASIPSIFAWQAQTMQFEALFALIFIAGVCAYMWYSATWELVAAVIRKKRGLPPFER